MSFLPYPKYKDSGIEWLGELPDGWEARRLKTLVDEPLKYGANEAAELDDRKLPRFVRITDIDDSGFLRDETFKSLPVEVAKPYLLKEGDVLLARSGATVGKSFIYSDQWGNACFAGYLIRARLKRSDCLAKWLYYFCQTNEYWGYVVGSQIQATIQNVSAEKYANLYLPLPNLPEQTTIAAFLDRETAKIDGLVAEQRRLMELLKEKRQAVISHAVTKGLNPDAPMKPSGIEWLGDVPEHWDFGCLTRIANRIVVGIAEAATHAYADEGVPILRSTNIRAGRIRGEILYVDADFAGERGSKKINGDDLITVRTGNAGVTAVVPEEFDGCQCFTMLITTLNKGSIAEYYCYWMNSVAAQCFFSLEGWGTAQVNISVPILKALPVPMPPPPEQKKIIEHLNHEVGKLDTLAAEAQRAIDLLQERRTALISAAVTGQINVRNFIRIETAA